MTEAQVLALINLYIVANGNNEITADVLRPILVAMLEQPNDKVGELSSLSTTDKTSIVNAINEVLTATTSGFEIHTGTPDPNVTPPGSFSIGDWYIRSGTSLYQYNGSTWVLLADSTNGTAVLAESFTYTAPNNTFTVTENIFSLIDVQIGQGCNFDSYATIANGNEVTIDNSIIFGGEKIKIIYNK